MTTCTAMTKKHTPCPNRPLPGKSTCFVHTPELVGRLREANRQGGLNKRTERRIAKRMPEDLKDTLATLYRVMAAVESGEMEPARASAIAAVSRAVVAVYESALVEAKISELEETIERRVA